MKAGASQRPNSIKMKFRTAEFRKKDSKPSIGHINILVAVHNMHMHIYQITTGVPYASNPTPYVKPPD